jgi:hypothetical protein
VSRTTVKGSNAATQRERRAIMAANQVIPSSCQHLKTCMKSTVLSLLGHLHISTPTQAAICRIFNAFTPHRRMQNLTAWCGTHLTNQNQDFCLVRGDVRIPKEEGGACFRQGSMGFPKTNVTFGNSGIDIKLLSTPNSHLRINCSLQSSFTTLTLHISKTDRQYECRSQHRQAPLSPCTSEGHS